MHSDREIEKQRGRYVDAAGAMQKAVTEAALRAATVCAMDETGSTAEQSTRSDVRSQAVLRRVLDSSGRLLASVARTAMADPFAPEAFDAAVFTVGKLIATAWRARAAGGDR